MSEGTWDPMTADPGDIMLARRRQENFEYDVMAVALDLAIHGVDVVVSAPDQEYADRVYAEAERRVKNLFDREIAP